MQIDEEQKKTKQKSVKSEINFGNVEVSIWGVSRW